MVKVQVRGRENPRQLLRRFKKACEDDGLMRDIRRKTYYEKPSDKKRRERVRRRREARKQLRKQEEGQGHRAKR